jgi:hypothetical protein
MKFLIFLGIILFPTIIFSQSQFDHSISAPYFKLKSKSKFYFSNAEEGKTLTIKIVEDDICMLSFDSKANKHVKRSIVDDIPSGYILHEDIYEIENKYYCFFTFWDESNKVKQFFSREINFDECTFKGTFKKIIEIKHSGKKMLPFVSIVNGDKLLVYLMEDPINNAPKNMYRKYSVYVFDAVMSLLSNGEMLMPYALNSAVLIDCMVTSKNVPYFLFAVPNPRLTKENKATMPSYAFELFRLNLKKNSIRIIKINHEEDKFIRVIQLFERPLNHEIICTGIYGHKLWDDSYVYRPNKYDFPKTQGFFVLNVDESEGVKSKKYIPYKIDNEKTNDGVDLTNINVKDIEVLEDNSIRFIAEEAYYYYWESNGSTFYTFYNKDIFVSKIDAEDDLLWMKRLKKDQKGPNEFRTGYAYLMLGNKHYFTFFDHVDNNQLDDNGDFRLYRTQKDKGCLRAYSVNDLTGEVSKHSVLTAQMIKNNYKINSMEKESALPISNSEFVIEMIQKKPLEMMLKIKIK